MSKFNEIELQKINLGPNDVLSVKLVGDDFDVDTMNDLKEHIKSIFPNNRVMVFCMPTGSDIQFQAIAPLQPSPLTEEEQKAVEELNQQDLEYMVQLEKGTRHLE